jgi:glycosyltransferase involved in cell wall biosynthesis
MDRDLPRSVLGPPPGQGPLAIAIIANEQTPYRLHLHRRISREMPEVELWTLFTHEGASSPWAYEDDRDIRSVLFGKDESSAGQQRLSKSLREWRKGGRMVRWLASHGIRAIVLFGYNDAARFRTIRWAAAHHIPCFLFGDSNIHGDRASGLKALVKRQYVPWILRQTTGVFHCGRLGREYFLRYGVPASRLYAFPYEPDYALFAGASADASAAARDRYGLPEGRRYVLFSGRMIAAKRPDLLLAAFRDIASERPEWDLVMVGDGPMRDSLQADAKSLANRVHWPGFIPDPTHLASLYAVCEVFVLPSDFEPWGVVLTEAATRMALVASSAVGAAADMIDDDGTNGRIFAAGDLDGLRRALLDVTDSRNIETMKAASAAVLSRWREVADPVRNLRYALQKAGLFS